MYFLFMCLIIVLNAHAIVGFVWAWILWIKYWLIDPAWRKERPRLLTMLFLVLPPTLWIQLGMGTPMPPMFWAMHAALVLASAWIASSTLYRMFCWTPPKRTGIR